MRFLMIVKASKESEAGQMPAESLLAAMAGFNEQMVKAGIMLDGAGLQPSSKGAQVRFTQGTREVIPGPFPETTQLISGYWIINVKSKEEAIEWAKRVPFDPQHGVPQAEVEIRPFFELEDFPPSDALEHHRQVQQQMAKKQG